MATQIMKRIFDLLLGVAIFVFLLPFMLLIAFAVIFSSKGSALYWSDRVGKNNKIFKMPKFRSMLIETPDVATHLLSDPDTYLSPVGGFLRRSSLDELPQLCSVILINWVLSLLAIGGVRIASRVALSNNVEFSMFNQ